MQHHVRIMIIAGPFVKDKSSILEPNFYHTYACCKGAESREERVES